MTNFLQYQQGPHELSRIYPLDPHPSPDSWLRVWHSQAFTARRRQQETPSGLGVQPVIPRMASTTITTTPRLRNKAVSWKDFSIRVNGMEG